MVIELPYIHRQKNNITLATWYRRWGTRLRWNTVIIPKIRVNIKFEKHNGYLLDIKQ